MALITQDPTLARRRFFRAVNTQEQAALYQLSMTLFSWLMTSGQKPALAVLEHDKLSDTDVVIVDAPATLILWNLYKETITPTFAKATDHASTASDAASALRVKLGGVNNVSSLCFPKGLRFLNGITCQGTTTAEGGTGSAADGASGVFLLAAAAYGPALS
jgi:hypothetical protein